MNLFKRLQKIGKALMTPIAILPAAGLLLGLGNEHFLGISLMEKAGKVIFDNLSLLFAVGVAIGLASDAGVAGLAAVIGFLIMNVTLGIAAGVPTDPILLAESNKFASVLGIPTLQMGVFGGIIVGILAATMYDKFYDIKLPPFLGFFAGKRFVPIITAVFSLILGVLLCYIWPPIQQGINIISDLVMNLNTAVAAFIFGVIERALIPFGLHHIFYAPFWFEFGTYITDAGQVIKGDISRFFAGDPTAGTFMTGKFPFMMFGLPAAAWAMYHEAYEENKKKVAGILLSAALTSFLTGITEPIEFTFLFVAPVLFGVHVIFAGLSFMLMALLGVKAGMSFSGGFIDYILYWNLSTRSWMIIPVGIGFAVIYYFGFRFAIRKWDLKTPGREEIEEKEEEKMKLDERTKAVIEALGGIKNIEDVDSCITRLRLEIVDDKKISDKRLKQLGASGVMKVKGGGVQVVFGAESNKLKDKIKKVL